ncbi:helix-turn-helix domain-containing protein [Flavobacteriaceae bacterium S0825]|uniref:helix-turn-helix domain-containing protein n=1 Tax=Gaetbulibacter sp. S0825 TaxID=2720084 RepID=UPI00142FCFE5|nr:helix-turn-helix domain-containing protein [Gaetbulibacter sp. S0825]MCK0108219.1 helix-turn-helix domain-containing protein [Flavobacteriaceae bacterium S0825]NIX63855.1 helix-turn-helix domain-containing protein [Gaetbulibacter sp. S0825]
MGNIQINNFKLEDLETAIKNVLKETVTNAVKEQITPNRTIISLFSRESTAEMLCISLPTLHEWTKSGIIKANRIGNRVLYKLEDINDALTEVNTSIKKGGLSC